MVELVCPRGKFRRHRKGVTSLLQLTHRDALGTLRRKSLTSGIFVEVEVYKVHLLVRVHPGISCWHHLYVHSSWVLKKIMRIEEEERVQKRTTELHFDDPF